MHYWIHVHKIGNKHISRCYKRVRTYTLCKEEGMVLLGYYDNDKPIGVERTQPILIPVKQRIDEIVTEYINSGKFSRIIVECSKRHDEKNEKVFEWKAD